MAVPKPKSVFLRPVGEAPTWGQADDARTPMDDKTRDGANADLESQVKLYLGFALQLQGNQLSEDNFDRSDDDEWLSRLAIWFGWDAEFRAKQDARVIRLTYGVTDEF